MNNWWSKLTAAQKVKYCNSLKNPSRSKYCNTSIYDPFQEVTYSCPNIKKEFDTELTTDERDLINKAREYMSSNTCATAHLLKTLTRVIDNSKTEVGRKPAIDMMRRVLKD
jgi:hypothetical protein